MKIIINNTEYNLSDEQHTMLTSLFRAKIEQEYQKLDAQWRLAAKAASRGLLGWIEDKVKKQSGQEESRNVRPLKGVDPVLHLFDIGERILKDMLTHVSIAIQTTGGTEEKNGTITGFTANFTRKDQSENGRPLDTDGDIGIWKDDSTQVPGPDVHAAVSNGASLHS